MADQESKQHKDFMSPEELNGWLEGEIRDSAKAHELRVKDATKFVTAYISGKLSPQQAEEQLYRYDRRWGEALYGTSAPSGMPDEDILANIDAARDQSFRPPSSGHELRVAKSYKKNNGHSV